jgi:hypothetical protein
MDGRGGVVEGTAPRSVPSSGSGPSGGDATSSSRDSETPSGEDADPTDPMGIGRRRRDNVTERQMKIDHPKGDKRKLKKYYTRQNELIDQFLGADDEESNAVAEDAHYKPKIQFAVHASFSVNFCLFVIQMYAAVSTGSLSVSPWILEVASYGNGY